MYFNNLFDLKNWDDDAKYIIFDDFTSVEFVPARKGFFGAQREFTVTDKYMGKATVYWGKPCIYLTNKSNPFACLKELDDIQWMEDNSVVIELAAPLF